ncbi:MAG: beta-ketoacyl synthase N-terminal-like domain-containing protein [Cytophagaceae bacterium]
MSIYIKALGNVSPQETLDSSVFLENVRGYDKAYCKSVEPNYKEFISPAAARRMGKVIKMGVASANLCLKEAGVNMPDAIITGTGLGCILDTEVFLSAIHDNKEQFLTPTSFIQSTHNTVGAQIALLLGCKNYNFTYVHRGMSFENALQDAVMLINEKEAANALVGGVDELTDYYVEILRKMGRLKNVDNTLDLLNAKGSGSAAGEGAAFFFISDNKNAGKNYAEFLDVHTFHKGSDNEVTENLVAFLRKNQLSLNDIDVAVLGLSGDEESDSIYRRLMDSQLTGKAIAAFKHLCGEHTSASAFAMWMGAQIADKQRVPGPALVIGNAPAKIKNILIYNHYRRINNSFMLLKAC